MEGPKGGPERIHSDAEPSEMKIYHLWSKSLPLEALPQRQAVLTEI